MDRADRAVTILATRIARDLDDWLRRILDRVGTCLAGLTPPPEFGAVVRVRCRPVPPSSLTER